MQLVNFTYDRNVTKCLNWYKLLIKNKSRVSSSMKGDLVPTYFIIFVAVLDEWLTESASSTNADDTDTDSHGDNDKEKTYKLEKDV